MTPHAPVGVTGAQGKGPGGFGEAHYVAETSHGAVFVADPLNWRIQRFERPQG